MEIENKWWESEWYKIWLALANHKPYLSKN